MIRHIVLLTLRDDTPPESVTAIIDALAALPAQIPSIRNYEVGADIGASPGNATIAATALFDDVDGYLEYRDHPAHVKVIDELIAPVRTARSAAQFEVG